jgi:hypothetical protein
MITANIDKIKFKKISFLDDLMNYVINPEFENVISN